jgi:hypothetical protein
MKTIFRRAIFLLLLAIPGHLSAQYWGERVLEKGFERTDFFFTPHYLNPYGIGSFRSTTPGLLSDPLLDMIVNPARLGLDSLQTAYLYTDFRSAREITEPAPMYYPVYADYATRVASDVMYYPRVYMNTRRELEPVFSGALFGRPLPAAAAELLVGLTYQLVLQDDDYYGVPQDIYRTAAGYDYNGMRAAAADNIPVVDKYSGKDNMHQQGHFISGFARYALPFGLEIGARVSRVIFDRDGSYGSANLWQYYSSGQSLWSNFEWRDQSYSHWDVSGGLEIRLTEQSKLGVSVGYLWGDATQSVRDADSSYYAYSSNPSTSFYNRSGNTLQNWDHNGKTNYYGIDFTSRISPKTTINLIYQYQHMAVDLGLGSTIQDTSYSTYSWENNGTPVSSYSQSLLSDMRNGSGTSVGTLNHLQASLQWQIDEKVQLSIGAQLDWQTTETTTSEAVTLTSRSAYWSTSGNWDSRYAQNESKDLSWKFIAERTSFQIPIFLTVKTSEVVELLIGLNRNMSQWKIEDMTLAIFRYRENLNNGVVERRVNFGERYTQPTEEVSDIRTTFLAGLTISPARALQLRLLMVPNFHDTYEGSELQQIQWWIGLKLTP